MGHGCCKLCGLTIWIGSRFVLVAGCCNEARKATGETDPYLDLSDPFFFTRCTTRFSDEFSLSSVQRFLRCFSFYSLKKSFKNTYGLVLYETINTLFKK